MARHPKLPVVGLSVVITLSLFLTACCGAVRLPRPTGPTDTPTQTPTPSEPVPPQLVQTLPARGEEHMLDAPIQLIFDQPMDRRSVERAFVLEPRVPGEIQWSSDRLVQFVPAGQGFERATHYRISIGPDARSAQGLALTQPVELEFVTVGFLEVAAVTPVDGSSEIATQASVTVVFNRPVVPLSALENQDNLPQPLSFMPPLAGKSEWLNTSIYRFTPDDGFVPATTYRGRIAEGLTDTTGGVLAEDFTWQFTTVMPAVAATYPGQDTIYVSPKPTIYVAFNQPMDHASVEAAFELRDTSNGDVVRGRFTWHGGGLLLPDVVEYRPYRWSWSDGEGPERVGVETMGFTPDQPLNFDALYRAMVSEGARALDGQSGTRTPHVWTFDTIAYPAVVASDPPDRSARVDPWQRLNVVFSGPMDPESIEGNFTITPPLSNTEVFTYWWDSDTHLELSFPVEPNSDYEVTLAGNIRGRYGQPLGDEVTVRWETRGLDPLVQLHVPYRVGTWSAYTTTAAYLTARNVARVNFALYQMPLADFLRANGQDGWDVWQSYTASKDDLMRQWSLAVDPPVNEQRVYRAELVGQGHDALEPGIYYLEAWTSSTDVYDQALPARAPEVQREIVIVSRHNLSLKTTATEMLVWATDLQSGDVLPDLPITIFDEDKRVLAKGTTGSDGTFMANEIEPREQWVPLFALVGGADAADPDFALAVSQWDEGIAPWRFDLPVENYLAPYTAHFFTDRPIYRPGQTIYFKGIVRQDDDARYLLPEEGDPVHVVIFDSQGTQVFEEDLSLSELGTLDGELHLSEAASLGYYEISASYRDEYFGTGFQVAEYRRPEFEVTVEPDRLEYVQGGRINIAALATYYFGGPVADAQVRYTVLSTDHFFNYQGEGWWDFVDYDTSRARSSGYYGERIAEGSGTTDPEGRFTAAVDADIAAYGSSQRFTLEISVTDVNSQEVSNRTEVVVHKGLYYIGLRPEEYVGRVDQQSEVELITVDWHSAPSPDHRLTVVFAEHNWYSVKRQAEDGRYYWESSYEDVPVFTTTVQTDAAGRASASFPPEKGGMYKVMATGLDDRGNEIRSATYLWVSGRDYVNWRQENNDRITLVADKPAYQVGDTATILVPHPYQHPVEALITVERGHIYRHWVQTLGTNSERIRLPITEDLIPNVFVSVVIVKDVDETTPTPGFKVGYVHLPIQTTEKELSITLAADKPLEETYRPGEQVTYDILVADSYGKPVEAELALSLVDLSVLALADARGPDIVNTFWRQRGLGVWTASALTLSGNRIDESMTTEAKGLGGGGGGEEFGPVRRQFPDTAYWNPALRTGADGRATVSLNLPDNLTTWRMGARGVTADTLVGQATLDLVSTKDLLIRPVAPRFFVVGDEADLAAVVHNNTDWPLTVEIALRATGLVIEQPASGRFSVLPNSNTRLKWQVTVGDSSQVTLRFEAKGVIGPSSTRSSGEAAPSPQDLSDAVEIALPVYRYSVPEVVAASGYLESDDQRLEVVVLPPRYDPTQGELSMYVDASLAAGMAEGLRYLEHFPYECAEQTVSRFLPNIVAYRAFRTLGLEKPDLESRLPEMVSVALQRLYNHQHYDGGWGWWIHDDSDPFLTAYVLLGMVEARQAGLTVDGEVIERTTAYLRESLRKPQDLQEHWQANRQAFVLYVLAEAGMGDLGRTIALFDQRDVLDTFGRAYLALALGLLEPENRGRVAALLSDMSDAAIVSATGTHWEETRVDYTAMNTDTRSSAIVLAALARLDPGNALAPGAVRWLMTARKDGHWETTQETSWAILALTDWMVATGELQGAYDWQVAVNGRLLGEGTVAQENIDETIQLQIEVAKLLAEEANRVVITRNPPAGDGTGQGRLYYSLYLRYYRPAEEVTALNRGIIVNRRYTRNDCDPQDEICTPIEQADVGDVVRVRLTIIAPSDLHYVVVEDPFPAGAEGVDQSLKTTSVVGEAPELVRTDQVNPWTGEYGWWWFSHSELRDEKAVLFATYLPRGTYEYSYLIRASLPGKYRVIPAVAFEMYFPEVLGRSDGSLFTISE